jgi:hypothetical protein
VTPQEPKPLLRCPFCPAEVADIDFNPHVTQRHGDRAPPKGYVRWLEGLRIDAGGKIYSGGSG